MKMLLIWQMIPDETQAFELDEDSEIAKLAVMSAGKYINGDELDEDDPIHNLSDLLDEMKSEDVKKVLEGPYSKVVVCGFLS